MDSNCVSEPLSTFTFASQNKSLSLTSIPPSFGTLCMCLSLFFSSYSSNLLALVHPLSLPWSLFQLFPILLILHYQSPDTYLPRTEVLEGREGGKLRRILFCGKRKVRAMSTYMKIGRPQSFANHRPVPTYYFLCTSPLPFHILITYQL